MKRTEFAVNRTKGLVLSAALVGASLLHIGSVRAEEAVAAPIFEPAAQSQTAPVASGDVAATATPIGAQALVAYVQIPLARPVRPGELPITGVGFIAQQYTQFQSAVSDAVSSNLGTPREVRRLLDKLRFSEPGDVAKAWLAHRGLIAAADPAFASGVQQAVSEYGQAAVVEQLSGKGRFARELPGADSAIVAVMSAVASDNRLLSELHTHFLNAAQAFQGNRWGMIEPLTQSRPSDFALIEDDVDMGSQLAAVAAELSPISTAQAFAPQLMERVLAYGARHVISTSLQTSLPNDDLLQPDRRATSCLNWAKLNLNQCIAAAHFPSEEAWCTGKHAIEDVRACWANVLPATER